MGAYRPGNVIRCPTCGNSDVRYRSDTDDFACYAHDRGCGAFFHRNGTGALVAGERPRYNTTPRRTKSLAYNIPKRRYHNRALGIEPPLEYIPLKEALRALE